MKDITTIKIRKETKERLDKLKEHSRETYDEILRKILFILNISKTNPERAKNLMNRIDKTVKTKKQYTPVYSEAENDVKENKGNKKSVKEGKRD